MSKDEIESLINLKPENFDYKEWLALRYAQDWVFLEGREPNGDYMVDFKKHHTPKERGYILKTMRIMRFANYLGNLLHGKAWRAENEGVTIDACCTLSEDRVDL